MFELVSPDKLVNGTKYKIDIDTRFKPYLTVGVFKHSCLSDGIWLRFEKVYMFDKLYNNITENNPIRNVLCLGENDLGYDCFLRYGQHKEKFYTFVSQNPQGQMERRSVNLIVRRLLGDECFTW